MKRNTKGQFIKTHGNTKYKKKQYKGKVIDEHRLIVLKELGLDNLDRKFIVHHIDGNTKNNNIDNLALMTITAHNRIHSHEPWNKGATIKDNEKWKKTVDKIHKKRNKTFLLKFIETYRLKYEEKKTLKQISKILNISTRQVSERLRRFKDRKEFKI